MIIVFEPVVMGKEHVPVNAALVEIILCCQSGQSVMFCGEKTHVGEVRRQLGNCSRVEYREMSIPPKQSHFYERFNKDYENIRNIMSELRRHYETNLLVITCGNESVIAALKLCRLLSVERHSFRCHVVMHGKLKELWGWRSRNPFIRWRQLRSILSLPFNRNITYVVMEHSIRDEFVATMPNLSRHIAVVPHPVSVNEANSGGSLPLSKPLKIAFLGLATESKGFNDFLALAQSLHEKSEGVIEFHAIGMMGMTTSHPGLACLKTKPFVAQLSRDTYLSLLKEMHFVCWPCSSDSYRYTASGVLLDAIALSKPVIGYDIKSLRNIYDLFGDIGYICDGLDDMVSTVRRIYSDMDASRYLEQRDNLVRACHTRRPEVLAEPYRDICAR